MSPRIQLLKKDLKYLKNYGASTFALATAVGKVARHYRSYKPFYHCLVNLPIIRTCFLNPNRLPH